ncbi:MAG TPA: hypothetical protein VFQ90_12665 [Stellaceae bacterium]|jgi:hypothetical protein|nr:hypothetical protein [Stellaceae bacterium]
MTDDPPRREEGDAVERFVGLLRNARHLPVNFIQTDERVEGTVLEQGGSAEEWLAGLAVQAPIYRWTELAGRYVLLPQAVVWDTPIRNVLIADASRLEAATRLVAQIRTAVPMLADLSEPPMIGDPRSPVYSQTVSLPRDGTILQHMVALLGADRRIVFTIERTRFGDRVLHFDRVPE